MIIGQNNLLEKINKLINKFPRFIILVGNDSIIKNDIGNYIAKSIQANFIELDNKIDSIRSIIDNAHTIQTKCLYMIKNGDDMSINAKNSLLKICEETPINTYIIISFNNLSNVLDTLKSRAQILELDECSKEDLAKYCEYRAFSNYADLVAYCDNFENIEKLQKDISIIEYVDKVFENIEKVESCNSFKISSKLSLKKDSDGYDLELFWKLFIYKCFQYNLKDIKYNKGIIITSNYLSKLSNRLFNKVFLFDNWVLDIRKEWLGLNG